MPAVIMGSMTQLPLLHKDMEDLVKDICKLGHPIIVEYKYMTDKRLFRGDHKIEWFYIYYQFDDDCTSCWQQINLPTEGNGISYAICMSYLYGLYNGLTSKK